MAIAQASAQAPVGSQVVGPAVRNECALALRSWGLPPARHLARVAVVLIIGLAGQAPSRRQPLSSNVRAHSNPHLAMRLSTALAITLTALSSVLLGLGIAGTLTDIGRVAPIVPAGAGALIALVVSLVGLVLGLLWFKQSTQDALPSKAKSARAPAALQWLEITAYVLLLVVVARELVGQVLVGRVSKFPVAFNTVLLFAALFLTVRAGRKLLPPTKARPESPDSAP